MLGKGMTEDELVLSGHEFEQAPRVGDGQGSLVYYNPWGHKESDMTKGLNLLKDRFTVGETLQCKLSSTLPKQEAGGFVVVVLFCFVFRNAYRVLMEWC